MRQKCLKASSRVMSKETYQGAIPTPKQWGDT